MKQFSLIAATLLSAVAQAQSNEAPEADYELITTAIHRPSTATALPVTVLAGDRLKELSRATLGDTLAQEPGIHNASFGPAVGRTVIRGQQGRRVLNMSNGIPSADAAANSADHAIAIEPVLAESVEVLRGPSTLLYGSGAIGGVINVIDSRIARKLPERNALAVEARHDTASDQDTLVGRADVVSGNLVWHVDAVRRDWNDLNIPGAAVAPGYREDSGEHADDELTRDRIANSDGQTETFNTGLSWVFDRGYLGASASTLDKRYGLPEGAHEHAHEEAAHEGEHGEESGHEEPGHDEGHGGVSIDMERTRYDIAGQWRVPEGTFIEQLDYRLSYTDYTHSEIEGGQPATTFTNEAWQQRLQLTHQHLGNWHGVLGLQSSWKEFGATGEESFIPITDITSQGVFLVEDFHRDELTLELGARYNLDEYTPETGLMPERRFHTGSLSASALWDLSPAMTLGLTSSRSQRAPSVEELYSNHGLTELHDCVLHLANAACERGDDRLGEETSLNTDLTLYLDMGSVSATVTAFYNDFSDYLFLGTTGQTVDGYPVLGHTQDDARFRGLEMDVTVPLQRDWQLKLFGDVIDGRIDGVGNAPRMPPLRLGTELRYSSARWEGFSSVMWADDQDEPGPNELPTAGYTRWDAGVTYRVPGTGRGELALFLKGRNLADDEIRLSTSFLRGFAPEPGRSVEAGLRYTF